MLRSKEGDIKPLVELALAPVLINSDSTYASNSVLGVFNGKKNQELIRQVRALHASVLALQTRCRRKFLPVIDTDPYLIFCHVKGHSDHPWNDLADRLADEGAKGEGRAIVDGGPVGSVTTATRMFPTRSWASARDVNR